MQFAPKPLKSIFVGSLCLVVLGTAYSAMTRFLSSPPATNNKIASPPSLKEMIAIKAQQEYDRWHRNGTLRETDTAATGILLEYWKLGVIPVSKYDLQNSSWQYHHPWSAVFISWVMQEAGAGNAFPYSNNHAKYIVWARENAGNRSPAAFTAYDVKDPRAAWPEPGDLVCMNRRSRQFTLQTINSKCISHCDIVVETNREKGYIVAIGGNVGQTVNKRIVWLNSEGFVDPSKNWMVTDEAENNPEGSQREIFGIIRVRQ